MKQNEYGSPKAVPSLHDTLAQESDGRPMKVKPGKARRPKGERNPARIAQERTDRIFAAWKAENAARQVKGKPPIKWADFHYYDAYEKAFKGE